MFCFISFCATIKIYVIKLCQNELTYHGDKKVDVYVNHRLSL